MNEVLLILLLGWVLVLQKGMVCTKSTKVWCVPRRSLPGPAPAVPLPPVTPADLLRINDCIPQFSGSKSKNIEIKSSFNPETATRSHKYSNNPIHNPNQAAGFRSAHRLSHDGGHVQELHQGRKP